MNSKVEASSTGILVLGHIMLSWKAAFVWKVSTQSQKKTIQRCGCRQAQSVSNGLPIWCFSKFHRPLRALNYESLRPSALKAKHFSHVAAEQVGRKYFLVCSGNPHMYLQENCDMFPPWMIHFRPMPLAPTVSFKRRNDQVECRWLLSQGDWMGLCVDLCNARKPAQPPTRGKPWRHCPTNQTCSHVPMPCASAPTCLPCIFIGRVLQVFIEDVSIGR